MTDQSQKTLMKRKLSWTNLTHYWGYTVTYHGDTGKFNGRNIYGFYKVFDKKY